MTIDYSLPKPVAGTSRATSPTETEILADVSDTIADIDTRITALAGTRMWLPSTTAVTVSGTPAFGVTVGHPTILFDATTLEAVAFSVITSGSWATFHIDLWWANTASAAGDVHWRLDQVRDNAGDVLAAPPAGTPVTAAASATANTLTVTRLVTGAVSPASDEMLTVHVVRAAADAADTLANDAAVLGLTLIRAS